MIFSGSIDKQQRAVVGKWTLTFDLTLISFTVFMRRNSLLILANCTFATILPSINKEWINTIEKVECSFFCDTLEIVNSLGDKFSHWESQNEAFIGHKKKKNGKHCRLCLISSKLCLTKNICNRTLNSLSK